MDIDLRKALIRYADAPKNWRPAWVIENFWQDRGVNFIAGPPKKARKSTLRRYLTACALTGEPVFGKFTVRQPIERALALVIEDHPGTERFAIDSALAALGHPNSPHIDFLSPLGFHIDNPKHRKKLTELIDEERYDLVTIDPLVEFHGADENSATEMARVAIGLRDIANRCCLVIVHHTSKPPQQGFGFSTRTLGESMRGSGVLAGIANTTLHSVPAGGKVRVKLSFEIKLAEEPEPLEVEIDQETWLWHPAPPLTKETVLQAIKESPGIPLDELPKLLGRRRADVLAKVKLLVRNKLARKEKQDEGSSRLYTDSRGL